MKYKVGDKVRIRQWKAMKREFGIDKNGDIPIPGMIFLKGMREYCGRVGIIVRVVDDEKVCGLFPFYKIDIDGSMFHWTDKMFEGYAFEYGEMAEFSDDGMKWDEAIYVTYADGADYPYIVVIESENVNAFRRGKKYTFTYYKLARPIRKHTIIINGEEIEISEEKYNDIKRSLEDR